MQQESEKPKTVVDGPSVSLQTALDRIDGYSRLIGYGRLDHLDPLHRSLLAEKIIELRKSGNRLNGEPLAFSRGGICMS